VPVEPESEQRGRPSVVIVAVSEGKSRVPPHLLESFRRGVASALTDSGSYRVIETVGREFPDRDARSALSRARISRFDRLVVVRLDHVSVEENVHHVHSYHDASASGHGTLISVASGEVLRIVDEVAYVSTRRRYSGRQHTVDLVLRRLVTKTVAGILWRAEAKRRSS
jgi:hypothetical protein